MRQSTWSRVQLTTRTKLKRKQAMPVLRPPLSGSTTCPRRHARHPVLVQYFNVDQYSTGLYPFLALHGRHPRRVRKGSACFHDVSTQIICVDITILLILLAVAD